MDCRTASLLLEMFRPGSLDADPAEALVLESHLASCASCNSRALALRQEHAALTRAIRAVPVPSQGAAQILAKLNVERRAWFRRMPLRHPRWATAAALFLSICLGGSLYALLRPAQVLDPGILVIMADDQVGAQPDEVEQWFAERGYRIRVPRDLNYNRLVSFEPVRFEGQTVPCLHFTNDRERAEVYVLLTSRFDPEVAQREPRAGSIYKIEFRKDPDHKHVFYMIKYTGDTPDWLFTSFRPGAA